jgi:hypothetical protein
MGPGHPDAGPHAAFWHGLDYRTARRRPIRDQRPFLGGHWSQPQRSEPREPGSYLPGGNSGRSRRPNSRQISVKTLLYGQRTILVDKRPKIRLSPTLVLDRPKTMPSSLGSQALGNRACTARPYSTPRDRYTGYIDPLPIPRETPKLKGPNDFALLYR